MNILVPLLSLVFGLLSAFAVGHLLVMLLFKLRPLGDDVEWSSLHTSALGSLMFVVPLIFAVFVLLSILMKGALLQTLQLSAAHQMIFACLLLAGILLQAVFAQRLVVVGHAISSNRVLVAEQLLFGVVSRIKRSDMANLGTFRPMFNPRFERVQVHLIDGKIVKLVFGGEVLNDLREILELH